MDNKGIQEQKKRNSPFQTALNSKLLHAANIELMLTNS